ncbi:uncharacterized protein [Paralichthys olivaceus]|uniref:uncharacterized protein n=1 Tax=Paralichthys olivaceus TaxID=8255 RepID=UPI003752A1A2
MEASPCAQVVSSHTASLLMSLNRQRQRAQFCDCVVRQRQSPGQLYPAHRCVLAASSPVLSSLLSSSGALVELQAPCLTGSVLALLLDYIYTGTLPYSRIQQYYYSLLTTACYLQMDELQKALSAWQKTEASVADEANVSTRTESELCKSVTTNSCSKHLPSTCGVDALPRQNGTGEKLEREDHPYSCDVLQMHSTDLDSCIKSKETDICGTNGAKGCSSTCDLSYRSSISEDYSDGVNAGKCTPVTYLTPQGLIQNIPHSAEEHVVSEVDKEVQKDQFHVAGTVNAETWQTITEEELERKVEDKRKSSSPCSSLPHPCCEAVPVICHSSRADMHQLAEVPSYHSVSKASVDSSRATVPRLASTDIDNIAEGVTTKQKNSHGEQDQDDRNCKYQTGTQSWDYQNSSDQCTEHDLCYRSSRDQSDTLQQHYNNSNADYFMKQNDEHMDKGLSHITDHNNHQADCDSFQSKNHTKYLGDDSVPQNKVCSRFIRGLKHKAELSLDDLPSKHQQLDWSDGYNVPTSAAAEETLSQDLRASLPVEMSDTGSDSQGEANDKHSYSSRVPDRMDRQELHCNPYEPRKDWYPTLHKAQTSIYDTVSAQQENDSDNQEKRATAAVDNVRGRLFDCERRTSLELSEITEPRLSFTNQGDSNMSDLMCSVVGQSYHGHLYYHCLPHEDTRLLHRDSDHKPSHPDYSNLSSDEEEEEANTSHRSLRPHFATGTTEQVLLLDISAKPAELLVAYKHKSDEKDIFGSGFREQRDDATSIVGVDKKKSRTAAMVGAESFDEGETKSWVGKTNLERPGDEGIQKAVSNPEEGENQSSTLTACSSPCIPDCVQASISSTLSVCIPATLSASMPRNISAHLSTPLHQPFQCSLCDRSFSQRGSLNRHVRSHLGVRPFPCPCCSMTFSRQYRVTEHMRVHQRCTHRTDFHKPPASSI